MSDIRHQATVRSALWAAYGDALGFITELAKDKSAVKYRSGKSEISSLIPWKRVLGGMYGISTNLVSGCYSDDTQLRLSTSRAINGQGFFDVEAFAKFELTVWQAYALGAGRGTKAATQSLTFKNKNWFNNFFSVKGNIYTNGGGNGAAMRIQPHVWAAQDLSNPISFLTDVVKNSITTHGHPRGIAGAVFHALSLATLLQGSSLTLEKLVTIADSCKNIPNIIRSDDYLSNIWLPEWEEQLETTIDQAFEIVSNELLEDLKISQDWLNDPQEDYRNLINLLHLDKPEQRGSGTKTALISSILVLKLNKLTAQQIIYEIVNALNTDTDTIATMFGALAGIISNDIPIENVQDQKYIKSEASRLYYISQKIEVQGFVYPNLIKWTPQRSAVANIFLRDNKLELNGFGIIEPISTPFHGKQKSHYYQWFKTEWGFTALIKIKSEYLPYSEQQNITNAHVEPLSDNKLPNQLVNKQIQQDLPLSIEKPVADINEVSIDYLTKKAIASHFNPQIIGEHILLLSSKNELPIESVISYSSIIAKAKIGRDKRGVN